MSISADSTIEAAAVVKEDSGGRCRAEPVALQWMHHHITATEASRPITEVAAEEGAELHRSELQHLKVKLDTWK